MTFFQNIRCCYIIRTEADSSCQIRIHFCNSAHIFRQEVCHAGLTDQHMHALSHLFNYFHMIIAFMVQTNAAAKVCVELFARCHRCTSEYRQVVLAGFCDSAQRIFVLFLHEFRYGFPYAETFRPFLYRLVHFLGKVEGNCRLRHSVRRFIRCAPEYFQRTFLYFCKDLLQAIQIRYGNVFIKTGDHTGGPVRHDSLGIAGNAQLAALTVDVSIDHTRHQESSFCIDDLGIRSDVISDFRFITDCCDHIFIDRDLCRIDLTCHNVDQLSIFDNFFRRNFSPACTDSFF